MIIMHIDSPEKEERDIWTYRRCIHLNSEEKVEDEKNY
jgi:hypothetical protein